MGNSPVAGETGLEYGSIVEMIQLMLKEDFSNCYDDRAIETFL
jgi:hypothetical protein